MTISSVLKQLQTQPGAGQNLILPWYWPTWPGLVLLLDYQHVLTVLMSTTPHSHVHWLSLALRCLPQPSSPDPIMLHCSQSLRTYAFHGIRVLVPCLAHVSIGTSVLRAFTQSARERGTWQRLPLDSRELTLQMACKTC